jgi:hypothetical protein
MFTIHARRAWLGPTVTSRTVANRWLLGSPLEDAAKTIENSGAEGIVFRTAGSPAINASGLSVRIRRRLPPGSVSPPPQANEDGWFAAGTYSLTTGHFRAPGNPSARLDNGRMIRPDAFRWSLGDALERLL